MRRGRLARFLAAAVVALLAVSPTGAPRTAGADVDEWAVTLDPLAKTSLCVGETLTVTGSWRPNPRSSDTLAPLSGPTINVVATGGTVDPRRTFTGSTSGPFFFTFRAETAGNAHLSAYVPDDAQANLNLTIRKTCEYRYTLNVDWMGSSAAGDTAIGLGIKLQKTGTLRVTDPNRPLHLESDLRALTGLWEVSEFRVPDCTLLTPILGKAKGILDVTADIDPGDGTVEVRLAPPDFTMNWYESFSCTNDGETQIASKQGKLTLQPESDPWVRATFPASGSLQSVKVDSAERWTRNWRSGRGNVAGYTATLKLERLDK
jgi:hypothetical protein